MAWTLREQGYNTSAFHPYYISGWNREKAYTYLGFEDLTFIEDGNPDTLAEGAYVNFEKCAMVARVIQDLCKHQLVPYNFRRVDIIAQWMDAWEAPSEKECFDLSLRVEPRGSQQ